MNKPLRVRGGQNRRGIRSEHGIRDQVLRQEFRRDVHADAAKLVPHISTTGRIPQDGIYFEGDGFSIREEYDPLTKKIVQTPILDHSLTAMSLMGVFPQRPTEKILIIGRQYDKTTGKMVLTTDEQVLKMSDKTLLRRGNPFAHATDIHRQTSISKRIHYNVDGDMVNRQTLMDDHRTENPTGVDLDTFIVAAEQSDKPTPAAPTKRTSGTILGSTQQRKSKSKK